MFIPGNAFETHFDALMARHTSLPVDARRHLEDIILPKLTPAFFQALKSNQQVDSAWRAWVRGAPIYETFALAQGEGGEAKARELAYEGRHGLFLARFCAASGVDLSRPGKELNGPLNHLLQQLCLSASNIIALEEQARQYNDHQGHRATLMKGDYAQYQLYKWLVEGRGVTLAYLLARAKLIEPMEGPWEEEVVCTGTISPLPFSQPAAATPTATPSSSPRRVTFADSVMRASPRAATSGMAAAHGAQQQLMQQQQQQQASPTTALVTDPGGHSLPRAGPCHRLSPLQRRLLLLRSVECYGPQPAPRQVPQPPRGRRASRG